MSHGAYFATLLALGVIGGCASGARLDSGIRDAPWAQPPLSAVEVPEVYLTQWQAAENRASCDLLATAGATPAEAVPRPATFAGGWAVAYDLPDQRSAFGVAGTGASASGAIYQWPDSLRWADGSTAGYGPEGGSGPNMLAYLIIPGQDCLYNVWSRLGIEHLEGLLGSLRWVEQSR